MLALLLVVVVAAAATGVSVKSSGAPNVSVRELLCNPATFVDGTPFARNLQYVLGDLLTNTPLVNVSAFSTYRSISPEPTDFVYGEGFCSSNPHLDCSSCLQAAVALLSDTCGCAVGARAIIVGCSIRYEAYPFSGIQ